MSEATRYLDTGRATGITDYLTDGGRIEVAERLAGHSNAKTTGLYDRRNDDPSALPAGSGAIYHGKLISSTSQRSKRIAGTESFVLCAPQRGVCLPCDEAPVGVYSARQKGVLPWPKRKTYSLPNK